MVCVYSKTKAIPFQTGASGSTVRMLQGLDLTKLELALSIGPYGCSYERPRPNVTENLYWITFLQNGILQRHDIFVRPSTIGTCRNVDYIQSCVQNRAHGQYHGPMSFILKFQHIRDVLSALSTISQCGIGPPSKNHE